MKGVIFIDKVKISTQYINLGQLLKWIDVIETGGEVKDFLNEYKVFLNDVRCFQRGKKVHPGDILEIKDLDGLNEIIKVKIEKELE